MVLLLYHESRTVAQYGRAPCVAAGTPPLSELAGRGRSQVRALSVRRKTRQHAPGNDATGLALCPTSALPALRSTLTEREIGHRDEDCHGEQQRGCADFFCWPAWGRHP